MAEITAASVKELRERTGAGMMDCKKALAENQGDMEASIDWLRAKGLSAAAKKAGRTAAEVITAAVPGKEASVPVILQAAESMRSFNIIPRHAEWDTMFWEQFQDLLFHQKGSAADLAAAARPKLEELLP